MLATVLMCPVKANIVLGDIFCGIAPGVEFLAFHLWSHARILACRTQDHTEAALAVRTSILLSALGLFVVGTVAFSGFRRKDEIVQKDREATR